MPGHLRRRDAPISLSRLLGYGKAWRSAALRELDPSRSPDGMVSFLEIRGGFDPGFTWRMLHCSLMSFALSARFGGWIGCCRLGLD